MINVDLLNTDYVTYQNGSREIQTIKEMPYFADEQYDLLNPKEYDKFIQDLERTVRTSFEYRQLIGYLRETEGMNECTFLKNVTNVDSTKVSIELHHTPLTLYDITSSVFRKRLKNSESIDIFDVAKEIAWLHYAGWVGLIPVSETVHELIHNQFLFVPTNVVRGDYQQFVDVYKDYIDPETIDSLEKAEALTLKFLEDPSPENIVIKQMELFNVHPTYVRIENLVPAQENIENARAAVRNRIDRLKNGKKILYHVVDPSK